MRILVIGSLGQLGRALLAEAPRHPNLELIGRDIDSLDITKPESLKQALQEDKPQWIINAAAFTAVDAAQDNPLAARALNAEAVGNIVEACRQINCGLIHISTDYVFDGKIKEGGYKEDDPTNPQSIYGLTKREGEEEALKYKKSIVLRTAWLYSRQGKNFPKAIIKKAVENPTETIQVVEDQVGSPTYAPDLAEALLIIADSMLDPKAVEKWGGEIFHFTNSGSCSWYEFAVKIKHYAGFEAEIKPIQSSQWPSKVNRPLRSVLDTSKIQRSFGMEIPTWESGLERFFKS